MQQVHKFSFTSLNTAIHCIHVYNTGTNTLPHNINRSLTWKKSQINVRFSHLNYDISYPKCHSRFTLNIAVTDQVVRKAKFNTVCPMYIDFRNNSLRENETFCEPMRAAMLE